MNVFQMQTTKIILALILGVVAASAESQSAIPYSTVQVIAEGDSAAVIAEKAAKVLPRANQTDWMRLERTFFLHFGVNTFNGVEWGTGREDASIFNPTALDANQWCSAMQNFDGKMIVLVCKHHDGFCYWPSRYLSAQIPLGNLIGRFASWLERRGVWQPHSGGGSWPPLRLGSRLRWPQIPHVDGLGRCVGP